MFNPRLVPLLSSVIWIQIHTKWILASLNIVVVLLLREKKRLSLNGCDMVWILRIHGIHLT